MPVIRHDQTRRSETPAGVMTTLASPTLGGATRPLWRVDMPPGAAGPTHTIDAEQIWTVIAGGATIHLADEVATVTTGDTVIIAPDAERQLTADRKSGLTAIVTSPAGTTATRAGAAVSPPWTT